MSERERNEERKIEGIIGELVREMEKGKEENGRYSEREGRVKQRENGAMRKREEEKR